MQPHSQQTLFGTYHLPILDANSHLKFGVANHQQQQ
jgi:hypothetical protein